MTVNGLQSSNRYLLGSSMFKSKSPVHLNNKVFTTTNLLKSAATRNATPMKLMPSGVMSLSSLKQQSALPTSSISLSNTNININTTTNANSSMFINQDGEKFILENGLQLSKHDIKGIFLKKFIDKKLFYHFKLLFKHLSNIFADIIF